MFATISDNNVKIITCSGTESQSKRAAKIANKIPLVPIHGSPMTL